MLILSKSTSTLFNLSISNSSKSDFEPAKLAFLAKSYALTVVAFLKSTFVA